MADQGGRAAGSGDLPARLGERFEIYPDLPLAELRSANAAGFVAADRERSVASIFGLVRDADPRVAGHDWHDALASNDAAQRVLRALCLLARLQALKGPPALAQRIAR